MVDIFPFVEIDEELEEETAEELPMAREYAWDFQKEDFKRRDGKMYKVEGKEAVKIWVWKLLKTPRYRYLIFTWDYGNELDELIGKGYTPNYTNAEAKGYVEEAIEYNLQGYVTAIKDMDVTFDDGVLVMDMTIETPYGEVEFIG